MQKGGEKQGHKWFARIGQSGAYKYFYSQAELAAYKAHQAGSAIKNKISTVKKRMEGAMTERDAKKGRLKNFSKAEVQRLANSYNKKGFVRLEPTIQEEKFDKFKKQAYKMMNDAEKQTDDRTKKIQKKADTIRKESNEIKNKPNVSSEYQKELESNSKKNKYFGMTKKEAPGSGHFTYDQKTGQTVYVKPDGTKVRKKKH